MRTLDGRIKESTRGGSVRAPQHTVAMKEMIPRTQHELAFGAKDSAHGTAVMRMEAILVTLTEHHEAHPGTGPLQIQLIARNVIAAADLFRSDLIHGTAVERLGRLVMRIELGHLCAQANELFPGHRVRRHFPSHLQVVREQQMRIAVWRCGSRGIDLPWAQLLLLLEATGSIRLLIILGRPERSAIRL